MENKEPIRKFETDAELVKAWRTAAGISQRQMSERFHISRGKVAHWEQGLRKVPDSMRQHLKRNWPKEDK